MRIKNISVLLFLINKAIKDFNYEKMGAFQIEKILYILEEKISNEDESSLTDYNFIQTHTGPYCAKIIEDLEGLVNKGIIKSEEGYRKFSIKKLPEEAEREIKPIESYLRNRNLLIFLKNLLKDGRDIDRLEKRLKEFKEG